MDTLMEFNQEYTKKLEAYRKRQKKLSEKIFLLEEEISEIKNKIVNTNHPQLVKVFNPIAEKIKYRLKADSIQHYGSFGIHAENSFYWKKDDTILGNITLILHKEGWAIRNERKIVHNYPKGSIAEMNGANYETIEITDKMNLDWLVEFVKRRESD